MKKIWNYTIVALAGLCMLACNKEMAETTTEENNNSGEYTYLIAIDEGTKAYLDGDHIAWESGDGIGWCAFSGSYGNKYSGYSSVNMTTPRTFSITSPLSIDPGGHIYACAPCSSINDSGMAGLLIPFEQYGVIQDAMPMVSLPIDVDTRIPNNTTTPAGLAQFINLGAVIQYNVFTSDASYSTEQIQSVTFTAESAIAGDFEVDLTSVSETSIPAPTGLKEHSVTSFLSTPDVAGSGKTDGLKVYQVVAPGTHSGTVTVTTDAATYSYPVNSVTFNRASIKTLNVNLASANATRRTLADYETLLTAREWQLVSVTASDGTDVTQNAGDLLTLNADYSLSVTCNTQADQVYDYMNDTWVDYGLGYEWDYWTREWSLPSFYGAWPDLSFTDYAYPLAIVTDNTYAQDYYITSLTNSSLILQYGQPCIYTITFSSVGEPTPADLLTAHAWELASVKCKGQYDADYYDVTQTAGNTMTLNSDHSFSFDCTANSGYVYDYHNGWYETLPDLSESGINFWAEPETVLEWSVSESGGTNYLDFTECAYPLVIVDDVISVAQSYEIAVLTDSCLELHHHTSEHNVNGYDNIDYIITFTPAS